MPVTLSPVRSTVEAGLVETFRSSAFTDAIARGRKIEVANAGKVRRDFTYVDDIVEGLVRVLDRPAAPDPAWAAQEPDPATSAAPHRIYNIVNDRPEELNDLIRFIEEALGRRPTGSTARGQGLASDHPDQHRRPAA